jgi:hypothetical protein
VKRLPNPMGCRWCGIDRRGHGRQNWPTGGTHSWQPPTQDQIKQRMQDRRNARSRPGTT